MRNNYKIGVVIKSTLCMVLLLGATGTVRGTDVEEHPYSKIERKSHDYALITHRSVGAPMGRFIMIRKDKDICAVRFTEYHRGNDAKPGTLYNSGEESFYAEYDWFYQGDGSGDFTKKNVKSGHDKLSIKAAVGVGRLGFQTGRTYLKFGPIKLHWQRPVSIVFYPGTKPKDFGYELAPTKWKDISEINVKDNHLKWFRYDENRKETYFSTDEL